jgi:hypothetical protein
LNADAVIGRLVLHPGATPSVTCERPMVGAALLGRLTEGRRAVLLPDLLASVFTLCGDAQRSTARRAVKAALGRADSAIDTARDSHAIALHLAREHLQRFALDLPTLAPAGVAPGVGWLRDAPVMALPAITGGPGEQALQDCAAALPGWLQRRLFGMPVTEWLEAWHAERGAWLARWSARHDHPVAHWLAAVRDDAQAVAWPCRALDLIGEGAPAWHELGAAIAADPRFVERPHWHGASAETGPWTRHGRIEPVLTAWDRLGARLADLAHAASGALPAIGALTLAGGEGLAWTEMSRGLLVHWVRLESGDTDADTARAERYHVLAPTEWNFHPDGAFARALASHAIDARRIALAAAALDPCLAFKIEAEAQHA